MISSPPRRLYRKLPPEDTQAHTLLEAVWRKGRIGWSRATLEAYLLSVLAAPLHYIDDALAGELARYLTVLDPDIYLAPELDAWPNLSDSDDRMEAARRLPISVYGVLLPGRQAGYGLPVGGVLVTRHAVIPRAVGRDIGCRVHLSAFPLGRYSFRDDAWIKRLRSISGRLTDFGLESEHGHGRDHPIFDHPAWDEIPYLQGLRNIARSHFGSSGTGNHFVDFGVLRKEQGRPCLALMTHSGSRGLGKHVAAHYHRLATLHHPKLPKELCHWAWLPLDSEAGQEYWRAMELCLAYSLACHHWLHSALAKELEVEAAWSLSCPHNFASLEIWRGQEVVVHRKGAIRLGPGETGIICGTMTAPTALVRGADNDLALHSASHGVARAMSRSTARRVFRRREVDQQLKDAGVILASGQADEWPGVYGDAERSLAAHTGLLVPFGTFQPRFIRMCGKNDPAED